MNRRTFIQLGALATVHAAPSAPLKKIAAITTTYFLRSHSDDIVTRELEGYWIGHQLYPPPVKVVSLYQDQIHPADVGQKLAMAHGVPIKKSIADAVTLGTGK